MWKKDDMPEPMATPRPEAAPAYERAAPQKAAAERATIGRSITINGQVTGDEDLLIQGRVEGSVNLKQHSVTVGPEGEVKADITARVITVDGRVEGNLNAEEQVSLRGSARVEGNITSPRVVLEDGARFRGGVDMGETLKRAGQAQPAVSGASRTAPVSVKPATEHEATATTGEDQGTLTGIKDGASPAVAKISR